MAKPKRPSPKALTQGGDKCPYDGAMLDERGFCWQAGGYPYGPPCSFVCPLCRSPLGWDGGCTGCMGTGETVRSKQDRANWGFSGDQYVLTSWHWIREGGPARGMSFARAIELSRAIKALSLETG